MYEIIAAVVIMFVLWFRWRKRNITIFSELGIPGPQPSLLFGNIIDLYTKGPIKCHEEWVEKYGRIVGYYYGMRPVLLIADPQMLKTIFIKDFSKFVDRVRQIEVRKYDEAYMPGLQRVVCSPRFQMEGSVYGFEDPFHPLHDLHGSEDKLHSVLNLKGQKWKEVRSVLTPTFSTAKMKKTAITMNSSVDTMLDIMREKAKNSQEFNIHDVFQRLTMDVIAKAAFGMVTDVQTNHQSPFLQAAKIFFNIKYKDAMVFIGLCFPSLRWTIRKLLFLLATLLNKGRNPLDTLKNGLTKVIELRRNHPEARKPDLLQMMLDTKIKVLQNQEINLQKLEAGGENETDDTGNKEEASNLIVKNMSAKEVIDTSITVFLAGYETTSTALAFTSYLLAKHPEVQDKVFEEVCGLIKNGEKLEYGSINRLPHLDHVLNESMRIYPPVYLFVNRYAVEDVCYGALRIPKYMHVQAPVYLMHHDPEYWPDPEVFDPERFNVKPNSDGITYLPFGIGPRNCIGMRFAQMETKLALAHMLYNFRLEISRFQENKLPISMGIQTLAPSDGVRVKLHPREHETKL